MAECPGKALRIRENGFLETLRGKCDNCGECAEVCPQNARRIFGRYYAVDEVLDIARKDAAFYRRSRGGITIGGGEPLGQPAFVKELLKTAREVYGLRTAIETSGYAEPDVVANVLEYVDFVLYDLKHIDPVRHLELTGVSNDLILKNIELIADKMILEGKELLVRVTIVPTLNDQRDNLLGIASFVKSLGKRIKVQLLPYHNFGVSKYRALDRKYPLDEIGVSPPSKEYMGRLEEILTRESIDVVEAQGFWKEI